MSGLDERECGVRPLFKEWEGYHFNLESLPFLVSERECKDLDTEVSRKKIRWITGLIACAIKSRYKTYEHVPLLRVSDALP